MAKNPYLPGNILSMAGEAADRLLEAGSGDGALLYLYLLKSGGNFRVEGVSKLLHWEPRRATDALRLLVKLGLAQEPENLPTPAPAVTEPPEYTASDITAELENKASPFPFLVTEVQRILGKPLSTNDLKCLYTIYDFTALPPEVILLVVRWSVERYQQKNGAGRIPRMPQIQREALRWRERGVDTVEAAEAYMKRQNMLRDRAVQILALLDIHDRPPVAKEKEYIAAWVDMGFPDETIRLAYESTVMKKRTMNWAYMDAILRDWHQKGLHTVAEVGQGDRRRPVKTAAPSSAGATRPQPTLSGEADRRARADMERMRELLRQEKEGS